MEVEELFGELYMFPTFELSFILKEIQTKLKKLENVVECIPLPDT